MFIHQSRLPHLLPPAAYADPAQHERETDLLKRTGWHAVATTDELSRPGDYLVRDLLGESVQLRNFDGRLHALSNICAHRHCRIQREGAGHSAAMTCQYHGWEYGADGCTRRIPEPHNFRPLSKNDTRIPTYRVETCGGLAFVALDKDVPSLAGFFGPFHDVLGERFSNDRQPNLVWDVEFPVNWKIVVENSLEAYHVPNVHPQTFRCDPGEGRSEHVIERNHTSFTTMLPFAPHSRLDRWFQNGEGRFLRWLGRSVSGEYAQHHHFPNLLFSFTDAISLSHCVIPTGPTSCRSIVRQYGIAPGDGAMSRRLCGLWGRMTGWLTRRILLEDAAIFPEIQAGLQHSTQPGMLGRCEERIHAFQQYIVSQTQCDRDVDRRHQPLPIAQGA